MKDKEFLQWIYDRMVNVHNENPNTDYMIKFRDRIRISYDGIREPIKHITCLKCGDTGLIWRSFNRPDNTTERVQVECSVCNRNF